MTKAPRTKKTKIYGTIDGKDIKLHLTDHKERTLFASTNVGTQTDKNQNASIENEEGAYEDSMHAPDLWDNWQSQEVFDAEEPPKGDSILHIPPGVDLCL